MTRLSGNNDNRTVLIIGTLIAAALIVLALFAVRGKQANKPAGDGTTVNFNLANVPFAGKADAPITVVSVEDFKCPACKNFEDTVASELHTKYVDTGKVKWYTLVWPFIATQVVHSPEDDSKYAAMAARCVYNQKGNDGFNAYKAILFRAQQHESVVWATKTYLKELANNLDGLDATKFATCLDNDETSAAVEADKKQVEDAKINSTPAIFVNGKKVELTGKAIEDVSKAIDAAIDQAAK